LTGGEFGDLAGEKQAVRGACGTTGWRRSTGKCGAEETSYRYANFDSNSQTKGERGGGTAET